VRTSSPHPKARPKKRHEVRGNNAHDYDASITNSKYSQRWCILRSIRFEGNMPFLSDRDAENIQFQFHRAPDDQVSRSKCHLRPLARLASRTWSVCFPEDRGSCVRDTTAIDPNLPRHTPTTLECLLFGVLFPWNPVSALISLFKLCVYPAVL